MNRDDYLRLVPKAELHCHFVSTMRVSTLLELCAEHRVPLRTDDLDSLLDYEGLPDFLDVFNAAHHALTRGDEIARVAYEGVEDAVRSGNLSYREYFVNPDNFADRGIDYPSLIDAMSDGLLQAERDFGVGFGIVPSINRSLPASAATQMVRTVLDHPRDQVLGIGKDDITPERGEDPRRFAEAYALARRHGLRTTAHVGENLTMPPENVLIALDELRVDRIDHGYRVVDDEAVLERALDAGVPFVCTPHSTAMLSGWEFSDAHRIARMVEAGLRVTFATDDAVFFKTDIGKEYVEALPRMGLDLADAVRIARTGFEAAWCDDAERSRLLADFDGLVTALDAALQDSEGHGG